MDIQLSLNLLEKFFIVSNLRDFWVDNIRVFRFNLLLVSMNCLTSLTNFHNSIIDFYTFRGYFFTKTASSFV